MTETVAKQYSDFVLPPSVVSRVDISRLVTEIEQIDSVLTAMQVRAGVGIVAEQNPTLSPCLSEFLAQNQLMLKTSKERTALIEQMHRLKDTVPTIHMTFASTADPESLGQLAAWLRGEVHPQAVIAVGLQPALVAGVYLRTPNHVHDLSLRAAVKSARGVLRQEMEQLSGKR